MRLWLLLSAMVLSLSIAMPVAKSDAQAAGPVKIGIIDVQKIMRDAKAAQGARALFMKDMEAKRAQIMAKDSEIKTLDAELKDPKAKLSDSARKEKADKLAKEIKDFRRLDADLGEELKKKDVELTQKLIGEVRQIVQDFSKKEKYTLILEKSAVVTSDDAIDITGRILKLYDARK